MKCLWVAVVACVLHSTSGANILSLVPMPSKSHAILIERLLQKLDERGHKITYITASMPLEPLGDVDVVHIPNLAEVMMKGNTMTTGSTGIMAMRNLSPWVPLFHMPEMGIKLCDYILGVEPVQKIIKSSQKFDLILGEIYMDESLLAGFAYKFNASIVAVQPLIANQWANYMVGNPSPAALIPETFLGFSNKMTLYERAYNFIYGLIGEFLHSAVFLGRHDAIMRKYFGEDLPPIQEIIKNTSLVLVNHHHSLGFPRAYVPNMVEVAGIHFDKPKPLPKDILNYLDNSRNGVVVFSLGTNIRSSDFPPEKMEAILKALSKLGQNILWKFNGEIPNLPENVKIMKWIPQSDVIAHPNVKVLITHGGLLSITEAVDRGVPVLGIPFVGDQRLNLKQIEEAGQGKILEFENISEESVFNLINEIIYNPKYKEVALERSKLFKDNPIRPLDISIWWIEYIIRHNGAPHLRSAVQDLAWYQVYLLDIYVTLATIFVLRLYIAKFILKKIFSKFSKTKQSEIQNSITNEEPEQEEIQSPTKSSEEEYVEDNLQETENSLLETHL